MQDPEFKPITKKKKKKKTEKKIQEFIQSFTQPALFSFFLPVHEV
jgi:hypothetical protein